jgi:hypothetical protein
VNWFAEVFELGQLKFHAWFFEDSIDNFFGRHELWCSFASNGGLSVMCFSAASLTTGAKGTFFRFASFGLPANVGVGNRQTHRKRRNRDFRDSTTLHDDLESAPLWLLGSDCFIKISI